MNHIQIRKVNCDVLIDKLLIPERTLTLVIDTISDGAAARVNSQKIFNHSRC